VGNIHSVFARFRFDHSTLKIACRTPTRLLISRLANPRTDVDRRVSYERSLKTTPDAFIA
jgi:hypothetical protein